MDLEALKKERETLNNDKRKGRAYLDLQLGNAIREIEDQSVEIAFLKSEIRILCKEKGSLVDKIKLAYLVVGATLAISAVMILAVWVTR